MVTPEIVARAVEAIKRPADYEYFFDRLTSPEWIVPLRERGFFAKPPAAQIEGDYAALPVWPESRYLARVAAVAPNEVAEIILALPQTDNARVLQDLAEALVAMPADIASPLVSLATQWLTTPYRVLLPETAGKLVAKLASEGQVDAALELARALFEVVPDQRRAAAAEKAEEGEWAPLPDAAARFEHWTYEELLKKHLPTLVSAAGAMTLELFADLLEAAVGFTVRSDERSGRKDFSYVWRPAIEPHDQNMDRDVKTALVSAVRDIAEGVAEEGPEAARSIVRQFEARRWDIFRRLALHVLRKYPDGAADLIAERLTDSELIRDIGVHREFWLLAHDQLASLSDADRNLVLQVIEEGPGGPPVRALDPDWQASEDEVQRFGKWWRLRRLQLLGESLPASWSERRDALIEELGEVDHPEFHTYSGGIEVGPKTPKTSEDLSAMRPAEIVRFLRDWVPSGEWMAASPEGLGRQLSPAVSRNAAEFADIAPELIALDPTYVRAIIRGWEEGLKAGAVFSWEPVLELCSWALEQPREIPERGGRDLDVDPGWLWTRQSIASLLGEGFADRPNAVPLELRQRAWDVVLALTDDPDPTPEHEQKYGGTNMDPVSLSINTTRGEAMHSAVRYGLWLRRGLGEELGEPGPGFDVMPELKAVLEAHLDPVREPSVAIRAVFGQWLPWLILLDRTWVEAHVSSLFPWESDANLAQAAWEAYLWRNQAYTSSLQVLGSQYRAAVARLTGSAPDSSRDHFTDPESRLAQHLMVFYWQGALELEDSLLDEFYSVADDELRAEAMDFVGRSLNNMEDEVSEPIRDRLADLWTKRLQAAHENGPPSSRQELAAFGWWFASAKLPVEWSLQQLIEALRIAGKTEPSHLVMERLASLATSFPSEVLTAFRLMIDSEDRIGLIGWRDEAMVILREALHSTAPGVKDAATDLIHLLGARRYRDFGELLGEEEQSTEPA